LDSFLGELAALGTSVCFSATSTQFTLAGRQVGSLIVNRLRLLLALFFLIGAHFLMGMELPWHISGERWFWFSLSGIIGLVLGDALFFQALIWIGPRLSMLLMGLVPIISSLAAWLFLSERLTVQQMTGILVTVVGIVFVILDGNRQQNGEPIKNYYMGILFGLGGAFGQAFGLITAKKGLSGDFPALSGTLIRILVASITLWSYTMLRGQASKTFRQIFLHKQAALLIVGGAFAGPFLGITLSLVAIQQTAVGIASTLMALPPVFLLPVGYFIFNERFGWRSIAGTFVAIAGVAVLILA